MPRKRANATGPSLTREDAATRTRFSLDTIDRARRAFDRGEPGGLPYSQPRGPNTAVRISLTDLVKWMSGTLILLLILCMVFVRGCDPQLMRHHHHRKERATAAHQVVVRADVQHPWSSMPPRQSFRQVKRVT